MAFIEAPVAGTLLALSLFRTPHAPNPSLDSSWEMVLGHALAQGWQFGKDLIFTYGPLAGPTRLSYSGEGFGLKVCWSIGSSVLFSSVIVLFAQTMRWPRRVAFYLAVATAALLMEFQATFVLLILATWLLEEQPSRFALIARPSLAFILGLFANVRFTNFLFSVVATLVAAFFLLFVRKRREAAATVGGFVVGMAGTWLACGQGLRNIPSYVTSSMAITSGYSSMATFETAPIFLLGLSALLTLTLLVICSWVQQRSLVGAVSAALIGISLFITWKNGFVRGGDAHVLAFFGSVLVTAISLPAFKGFQGMSNSLKLLTVVPFFLSAWGYAAGSPAVTTGSWPALWIESVKTGGQSLLALPSSLAAANIQLQGARLRAALPQVRAKVRDETVDVLGFEQGVVLLNELRYAPRPIFQSYAAYAPKLIRANREYFDGERAPKFVLAKLQPIDGRYPSLEDAPVWLSLIQQYQHVLTEKDFALWERRQGAQRNPDFVPLTNVTVGFGDWVQVPASPGKAIWAEVRWSSTSIGKMVDFLYKLPPVFLEVREATGVVSEFRLIQSMASEGFLLSPLVRTTGDWSELVHSPSALSSVVSLRLRTVPGEAVEYFEPKVSVHLSAFAIRDVRD